jgi:hypothetical protein
MRCTAGSPRRADRIDTIDGIKVRSSAVLQPTIMLNKGAAVKLSASPLGDKDAIAVTCST